MTRTPDEILGMLRNVNDMLFVATVEGPKLWRMPLAMIHGQLTALIEDFKGSR